jgi:hypothetical protein
LPGLLERVQGAVDHDEERVSRQIVEHDTVA